MSDFKGRVLCTEDDEDSRELITIVLEQAGYKVHCTDSHNETIKLAKAIGFDLILVDNWLPEITGGELTRQIRTFNKSTPILFYSGAAYDSDKREATKAGAQGYLVKPLGLAYLVEEVGRLIAEAHIAFPVALDLPAAGKSRL